MILVASLRHCVFCLVITSPDYSGYVYTTPSGPEVGLGLALLDSSQDEDEISVWI
jgi:hypothetical protein